MGRAARSLDALLSMPCLRGISTGDFQQALSALLGTDAPKLPPGVPGRPVAASRPLCAPIRLRPGGRRPSAGSHGGSGECVPVIPGARPEGKTEPAGLRLGLWESAQSWHERPVDSRKRGPEVPPGIAAGDGAAGDGPWAFGRRWKRSFRGHVTGAAGCTRQLTF